jgi:DNA-directed RNA polymerase subunit E'/Rpb7
MAQQSLYYLTQLQTRVVLLPNQLNANWKDNLLMNLRNEVEKKIVDNGVVIKINKIISHNHGIIDRSGFSGSAIYTVDYSCHICSPADGMELVCILTNSDVDGYLICSNGPLVIMISVNMVESEDFQRKGKYIVTKDGQDLTLGQHLKVSIISYKMAKGQSHMTAYCKLISLPTSEEIAIYEKDQILVTGGTIDDAIEYI